jgi:cytochrome c-type biogenesis protein CcmH/NrfG
MKASILFVALAALLVSQAALPADSTPAVKADPAIEQATKAVATKDWPQAQAVLRDALARDPNNPDYHNLFAYSIRKGSNPDMNLVFKHYNEALRLDPKHRGAHEYIGEAYLMAGNLPKAKEHLSSLDKLCFFPCSEFTDLKKSIAAYEAKAK